MHRAVTQGVDKINAQVADTLLTGEIDRELNKAIQRFITTRFQQGNRYGKGFEESQKRRDDLRTLVKDVETNTDFKEQLRNSTHPNGALYIDSWKLPYDYMYMINAVTIIARKPDCSKISYQMKDQDDMYSFIMDFKEFIGNGGTTYIDEIYLINNIDNAFNAAEWGAEGAMSTLIWQNTDFEDVAHPENQMEVVENIITGGTETLLSNEMWFPIFWESWDNSNSVETEYQYAQESLIGNIGSYNYPNSLILVGLEDMIAPLVGAGPQEDGSIIPLTDDPSLEALGAVRPHLIGRYQNNTVVSTPVVFNQDLSLKRVPSTKNFIREAYKCKMVQHDDIFAMISDPFNKTKYSSPLTVMRGDKIDVFTDDLFIADKIRLTYIRKPAMVSLGQFVNCDLPDHTHEEIVMLAVGSILEAISDPRYQTHSVEKSQME